ncbi:MAG: hypothetical protein ACTSVI_11845 [Promethearchaeota archaeon]
MFISFSLFSLLAGWILLLLILYKLMKESESENKTLLKIIYGMFFVLIVGLILNSQAVEVLVSSILDPSEMQVFTIGVMLLMLLSLGTIVIIFLYLPPIKDFFWKETLLGIFIFDIAESAILFKSSLTSGSVQDK